MEKSSSEKSAETTTRRSRLHWYSTSRFASGQTERSQCNAGSGCISRSAADRSQRPPCPTSQPSLARPTPPRGCGDCVTGRCHAHDPNGGLLSRNMARALDEDVAEAADSRKGDPVADAGVYAVAARGGCLPKAYVTRQESQRHNPFRRKNPARPNGSRLGPFLGRRGRGARS